MVAGCSFGRVELGRVRVVDRDLLDRGRLEVIPVVGEECICADLDSRGEVDGVNGSEPVGPDGRRKQQTLSSAGIRSMREMRSSSTSTSSVPASRVGLMSSFGTRIVEPTSRQRSGFAKKRSRHTENGWSAAGE
jgi:hypothetical protein